MMTGVTRLIQITQRRLATTWLKRFGQIRLFRPLVTKLGRMARASDFTTTVHGVRLTMPGHVDYYTDRFEPETVKWLSSNLRPGAVVADIGAHIGFLTLLMARLVGETGRVFAFEPAPENVAYLTRNVASNGATNVVVVPVAAGANSGTRTLYLVEDSDMDSLFPGNPFSRARGTVEVEQVSVDDVVPYVDVAKIDVEGAEIEALRGMGRLLAHEPKPTLVVEWSPTCQVMAGHRPDELIGLLRKSGYSPAILGGGRNTRTIDDVLREVRAGTIPQSWYANLLCIPTSRD